MGTVIIEQFNPRSGHWNKLYEVDEAEYDANAPITENRYDGPYRTRFVDCGISDEAVVIEEEVEEFAEEFVDDVREEEVPKSYSWE